MEYLSLGIFIALLALPFVIVAAALRRYHPAADKCEHGYLMGSGYAVNCEACRYKDESASEGSVLVRHVADETEGIDGAHGF